MNEYIAALVDEFYQLGVRHAVFSPGSRSTTMAMLFTEYEGFETYMNIDERSASFMALGIAKAHKEPTVLVCTSGSAVAHYLPAILEAQYSGVPLIVLSADRPYTLLHTGAPQTVDQQKIFGTAVNYYEELAVPQKEHYYTYPRQVARKAYMKAMVLKKDPCISIYLSLSRWYLNWTVSTLKRDVALTKYLNLITVMCLAIRIEVIIQVMQVMQVM